MKLDIRIPCKPNDKVEQGEHKHLCDCGTCWKHNANEMQSLNKADHRLAHTCASCGSIVGRKHYGFERFNTNHSDWNCDVTNDEIDRLVFLIEAFLTRTEALNSKKGFPMGLITKCLVCGLRYDINEHKACPSCARDEAAKTYTEGKGYFEGKGYSAGLMGAVSTPPMNNFEDRRDYECGYDIGRRARLSERNEMDD